MISPALPGDSGNNTRYLEPLRVSLLRGTDNCLVGEVNDLNEDPLMNSGVVSLPMTITIKCISPDMHISVLSITTVRFISFSDHLQRTANSIFMEEEELFQAIERSINQVTPENTPIFTEVRAHKSSIEIATCEHRGVKPMLCLYTNINGYVLKPEKVDPVLAKARKTSSFKSNPNNYAAVSIGHLPSNDYGEWVFPSISKLKDDTLRVSRFMAELGQNFYTDYESMELYTLYNTEEKGVEISDWLVYSMIVSMIVCFCFWVTISILLRNTPYSDSLYTSISRQLESKTKMTGPSIMRSTVDPATIEGIPLIYNQDGPTI
ncbi:hypothetical protein BGZ65_009317 [Modicella reniformis]|uniref:Uncharacterized protein n=1 Tax=Modicella reniformis TaxID=1440133 RepID=A0A9P6M7Y5_9FUNG|nr:hypothetical protein BGZ65_009317 [Modicella reniformis]